MDRTLVHTSDEVKEFNKSLECPKSTLVWVQDVSFRFIPPELLTKLWNPWAKACLDLEHFFKQTSWLDSCLNIWNSFLFKGDEILTVMWGDYDLLLQELHVKYLTNTVDSNLCLGNIEPYPTWLLHSVIKELKRIEKALNLKRIYFISNEPEAFLKKLGPLVKPHPTSIMEVI